MKERGGQPSRPRACREVRAVAARAVVDALADRRETAFEAVPALLRVLVEAGLARVKLVAAAGYQVGTGVMCALPGQTMADLARDIVFFGDMDVDMIGMGPYIPHPETPLAAEPQPWDDAGRLRLGLNMIAATRLYLHDVNMPRPPRASAGRRLPPARQAKASHRG